MSNTIEESTRGSGPKISLCIITGNEEPAIERFLNSFKDAFDELCIVRAVGCQPHDRTLSLAKEWCKKHGKAFLAGVYENARNDQGKAPPEGTVDELNPATWPHVDSFCDARNMAWSMATCPWQLWGDADDLLVPPEGGNPGGAELIRLCAAAETHDYFFFSYHLRTQSEKNVRERLFRTGISKWVQPVHEQCRISLEKPGGGEWKALIEPRVIYSHAPDYEKKRDPMRNRRIMAYHTRWINAYAFEMHREWFYEWQLSKNPEHAEKATKWAELAHQTDCLPEQRYDMLLHQAKIAVHKDVEHAIDLCWSAIRIDPKNREAWGDMAGYELQAGRGGRAEVATGFMQTIPKAPESGYPQSTRYFGWEGSHLRARALRARGKPHLARKHEDEVFAKHGKRISLLHATWGRPEQALLTRNIFFRSAFVPLGVEHIFAIDEDDMASLEALKDYRHVVVKEPRGCVKAWNAAAAESTGNVLVQLSDDWMPCPEWDVLIWEALQKAAMERTPSRGYSIPESLAPGPTLLEATPLVLAIHDGHRTDALLCMAILTRARYEQQTEPIVEIVDATDEPMEMVESDTPPYLFAPEYFGVFSDNEFTVRAYEDGVVVQAQHIVFNHQHPVFEGKPIEQWDETHRRQNAPERYEEGLAIFNRRNPKYAIQLEAAK